MTFFDALTASLLAASEFNRDDVESPAAVLWPDEKKEWERLIPRLRGVLPQFLTFGTYDPASRSGPAIWLRSVLAGKIAELAMPVGTVPILYLPGVSRSTLRATEDCPQDLKPLAELQYRGVIWSQANAKDWTVAAYLQTEKGGLNLTLAKDQATSTSLRRAVEKLADAPIDDLKTRSAAGELNSHFFDSLVSDDLVDDLLSWLSHPKEARARWETGRWETLCSRCLPDYGFDPARDGELVGAEKLGTQPKAVWKTAWKRYTVAPARYPGLEALLRKAKPPAKGLQFEAEEAWPQDNEAQEASLRKKLLDLPSTPEAAARKTLIDLEEKHGVRREWVWARLNYSPMASAIRHLATLASVTTTPLTGATLADMVKAYTEGGWKADAAVLDAIAAVAKPADIEAVNVAVAHVYKPWLRDAAELFQKRVAESPLPGREKARLEPVFPGTCILFADGLRYDVGQKFLNQLAGVREGEPPGEPGREPARTEARPPTIREGEPPGEPDREPARTEPRPPTIREGEPPGEPGREPARTEPRPPTIREGEPPGEPGREPARTEPRPPTITKGHLAWIAGRTCELQTSYQFVALPSVTPTAKPAVSPVAAKIKGTVAGEEFRPCVALDGKDLTPDRFRKLLADEGVQYLANPETGDPNGKAWTEFGNLDSTGHAEGSGLARRIPELLANLAHRVESLLEAGWKEVRVVTDHGWLIMPKGLPKSELPKYLTATRWRRCAVVKPTASVDLACFSWFWFDDVRIACPPGIDCFMTGEEYNHGGLSLQECVVPQIVIRPGGMAAVAAKIESLKWAGLRCRIKVTGAYDGCKVDLRDKAADPETSLAESVKAVGSDGSVSVVLKAELDTRVGTATTLVLLDRSGNVVDRSPVTLGE